jgi:GxxExxY protein
MDGDNFTTERIIGCAIEVHKYLGPGLLESVYESALCVEFKANSLPFKRQVGIPLYYKGELISEHRPDLIVDEKVIVEVKSVEALAPIHMAQLLTYLRVTSLRVGLILNFNSPTMKQGTRRVVLNPPTHG